MSQAGRTRYSAWSATRARGARREEEKKAENSIDPVTILGSKKTRA